VSQKNGNRALGGNELASFGKTMHGEPRRTERAGNTWRVKKKKSRPGTNCYSPARASIRSPVKARVVEKSRKGRMMRGVVPCKWGGEELPPKFKAIGGIGYLASREGSSAKESQTEGVRN